MLAQCPVCSCSLAGLPPHDRCPLCTFEYDQRMQVIERSPTMAIFFTLVVGLVVVACVLMWPVRVRELRHAMAAAGILYLAWYVIRFWTGHHKKLVVGPAGLILITDRRVTRQYVWDEIGRVELTKMSLDIHKRADGTIHSITEMDLGSAERLKMAYQAVMSMRESASQTQGFTSRR